MSEDRDVAVVGMACVFPGAADLESYWRNVVNGVDAISELPAGRWPGSRNLDLPAGHLAHIPCRRGGFVPTPLWFDAVRHRVMPSAVDHGDPDQFIVLELMSRALSDAGLGADDPRRATTDVVVGRGGYTSNKMMDLFLRADLLDRLERLLAARLPALDPGEIERVVGEMRDGLPQAATDSLVTSIPNLVASRAANRLDLGGVAYTVDAACASSLIAVEQTVRRLREGLCDVALACGINFTHVPTFWYLFARILALSPSGALRPFDRKADGLLIGEGAGAVVLKRLEDARRDGDAIYAVVRGVGSASDGAAAHILAPAVAGQVRALERAYADAGVEPESVDLLEAHGTGTVEGDLAEIASIGRFFGRRRLPHATRVMGSVKSMIGHTMPAAGIASFIKTALALRHKILPPSLHCDEPRPELSELPFFVSPRARPWLSAPKHPPRRAGINAFGFGGVNAHVVLEELREESRACRVRAPRPALGRPTELLCFAAADPGGLAQALRRAARFVNDDRAGLTLEELAHALAREADHAEPCRLAFVAARLEGLALRLEGLAARLERGGSPLEAGDSDVFYTARVPTSPGRLAGLFPGLAFPGLLGNYPEHLLLSGAHSPPARAVLDLIESRDAHPDDPLPTSFLLGPPEHLPSAERERLKLRFAAWTGSWLEDRPQADDPTPIRPLSADERLLSVMGMLASNEIGWRRLEPFKLPFEMLCGQSLGEISALCAAGCFEFQPAIERLWPYLSIDPRLADLGCLAFVAASEAGLAPHLARLREVEVAIHLSPQASIVGGPEPRVAALVQELRAVGIMCQKLPFPPIHTSHLLAKQREFEAMDHDPLPLGRPRLTVYSNLTGEPLSGEAEELRQTVAGNVSRPIRFWQTLRRMYADGARVFIQVGTGSLAGNVRTVLGEDDVLSIALDVDYRDPVTQLQHLVGKLFVSGIPLELEALFEARENRSLTLDAPRPEAAPPRGAVPLCLYWPPLHVEHEAPPVHERPAARAARPAPASLPFVGRVVEHAPGLRLVHKRRFALADDLYLADHTFAGRQHGLPLAASFPVVPLTVTLEMLAESAACLVPGRGVIGLLDVRARKWIALDGIPELDVEVRAVLESDEDGVATVRAEARVDGAPVASAVVRLASRYRLGLELRFETPADAAPFPLPAERLYADHHFFHGPRFQCLAAIHSRSERSISGEAIVPSYRDFLRGRPEPGLLLDPVVLDGAGQLLGALFHERGVHILPVAIECFELYRPAPPAGTRVPLRVELVDLNLDERRVSAMIEVQDGAGRVWFRVRGWQDVVFRYARQLVLADRDPLHHTLADESELPGLPAGAVATVLPASSLRDARPEAVARFYLSDDERPAFREIPDDTRRQREWLMGRIAAKDAARLWLARRRGGALLHPSKVSVASDAAGRPVVRLEGESLEPCLSIAHKDTLAVAVAADRAVGVDLEREASAAKLSLSDFATEVEIERIPEGDDWPTRLWCGKEAAAKALGTGLGGRPRAFEAIELDPDGRLLVACGGRERVRVRTSRTSGFTFAVASLDGQD